LTCAVDRAHDVRVARRVVDVSVAKRTRQAALGRVAGHRIRARVHAGVAARFGTVAEWAERADAVLGRARVGVARTFVLGADRKVARVAGADRLRRDDERAHLHAAGAARRRARAKDEAADAVDRLRTRLLCCVCVWCGGGV
jgi:hypothetical protein